MENFFPQYVKLVAGAHGAGEGGGAFPGLGHVPRQIGFVPGGGAARASPAETYGGQEREKAEEPDHGQMDGTAE